MKGTEASGHFNFENHTASTLTVELFRLQQGRTRRYDLSIFFSTEWAWPDENFFFFTFLVFSFFLFYCSGDALLAKERVEKWSTTYQKITIHNRNKEQRASLRESEGLAVNSLLVTRGGVAGDETGGWLVWFGKNVID